MKTYGTTARAFVPGLLASAGLMALLAAHPQGAPIVMDGASRIETLRERLAELMNEAEEITNTADEAGEDLGDEELTRLEAIKAEVEKINRQVAVLDGLGTKPTGRKTKAEPNNDAEPNGNRKVPASPRAVDPRGGFTNFGEFGIAVRQAAMSPGNMDERLRNAATTYGSEGVGADGGFAVPPEFRRQIWQKVMDEENLATRCDRLETSTNSLVVPKDETTPWQSTGGVQAYWEGEADAAGQSKPQLGMDTMRLNKLMALVPITEELLDDAPGLESWLKAKAPAKMRSKLNTAIIRGTGAGQPLGILNSASLITVDPVQSQAADTVLFANISAMWNRLWGPLRRNAVWLINQDIEPQLDVMEFAPGSTVPIPVYLPAGGVSDRPYATLKGRPVIPVEACSTLGDKGDIIAVDLSQYALLTKAGQDIKTDVSIHLWFDQAATAFRFIFRVTGHSWWGSSIAPQFGSTTRSWAVTLADRAG